MALITDHRLAADEPAPIPAPEPAPGFAPLSPWPTTAIGVAAAVVRLHGSIGQRDKGNDDATAATGAAAAAMVEIEAPDAPQPVKDEAVIRLAGYWTQSDFGGIESETSVGNAQVSYFRPAPSAFRYCGAKSMLSPWKRRRARAVA